MANSTILFEPEIEVKVKEEVEEEAEEKTDSITEDESGAEINKEMENEPEEKLLKEPLDRSLDLYKYHPFHITSGIFIHCSCSKNYLNWRLISYQSGLILNFFPMHIPDRKFME